MSPLAPIGEEREIYHYLLNRKILIADPSVSTRTTIINILKDLGARWANITQVVDFVSAENLIHQAPPDILICDLHLSGGSGHALVDLWAGTEPAIQGLSVIVSRNATPAAIVDALEAGVDGYIIKPFTAESFQEHFCRAAIAKLHGGPYREAISRAQSALVKKDFAEAKSELAEALALSERPSLAHFYLGKLYEEMNEPEMAQKEFEKGLEIDPHHFRCLLGLFDLLKSEDKSLPAYEVSRKIVEAFPLSALRISEMLDLVLKVQRFDDLSILYKSYLDLDVRSPDLSQKMIDALLRGGESLLKRSRSEEAAEMFRRAIISSGRVRPVLSKSIHLLLENKQPTLAYALIAELPLDQKHEPEIRTLVYEIDNTVDSPSEVFEKGQRLLKDGVLDPIVYRILAHRAKELGKLDYAEQLEHDASKR